MSEGPVYLILGRGRWASVIQNILDKYPRRTVRFDEPRIRGGESDSNYRMRLERAMVASGATIAWMCIPAGPWIPAIASVAMQSGLDVIVECPWLCPPEVTGSLLAVEQSTKRLIGVHYEYCLLDEVHAWRVNLAGGEGYTFSGIFEISRPGRHGAVAQLQLGSHLMSVKSYAVPKAGVGQVSCGFDSGDRRVIWLDHQGVKISTIDFQANSQPIIQRFIQAFELGRQGAQFPFGLAFAKEVAAQASRLVRPA